MSMRAAVLELLADLEIQADRQDAQAAQGWVIVVRDDESHRIGIFGIYENEQAALQAAVETSESVNEGVDVANAGEKGWTVTPHPILPRD